MNEVVICCTDTLYSGALAEGLSQSRKIPARIKTLNEPSKLEDKDSYFYVVKSSEYQLWNAVISEEKTLFLKDIKENLEGRTQISIYSSLSEIEKQLLLLMVSDKSQTEPYTGHLTDAKRKDTKLIGFYSPVHRCSQTTLSVTLGNVLSENLKVLYLSFENFSGFSVLPGMDERRNLADLLLILQTKPSSFKLFFDSILYRSDSLDIIPPIKSIQQILEVRGTEWIQLISAISTECDYDVIILDLTESIHGLFDILAMCESVYTLTKDDPVAIAKLNSYETLLRDCDYENILEKTVKKGVPYIEEIPDGLYYKSFSEISRFAREMIMGDGLYARLCFS